MIELDRIEDGRIPELIELYRTTWWAAGRTVEEVRTLVRHSDVVIGLVDDVSDRLVAFARVLTDRAYFALLLDVIVAEERRGTGVGHTLMARVLARPELTMSEASSSSAGQTSSRSTSSSVSARTSGAHS